MLEILRFKMFQYLLWILENQHLINPNSKIGCFAVLLKTLLTFVICVSSYVRTKTIIQPTFVIVSSKTTWFPLERYDVIRRQRWRQCHWRYREIQRNLCGDVASFDLYLKPFSYTFIFNHIFVNCSLNNQAFFTGVRIKPAIACTSSLLSQQGVT